MSELITHIPEFISRDRADHILNVLQSIIPWTVFTPSPKSRQVWRWDDCTDPTINIILMELISELQQHTDAHVQGIFCNLYLNGEDYCPYHRDKYNCDVWTLSLGDTRDFLVKKDVVGSRAEKWTLKSGDLYFMDRMLHKNHVHCVPVRKGRSQPRISLVFFTK